MALYESEEKSRGEEIYSHFPLRLVSFLLCLRFHLVRSKKRIQQKNYWIKRATHEKSQTCCCLSLLLIPVTLRENPTKVEKRQDGN